jgi:lysophospholipase L1-like esterase
MRLSPVVAAFAVAALTLTGLASGALAAPLQPASRTTPIASPHWSMAPMAKDADGDGIIDGDGGVPTSGALTLAPSANFEGAGNGVAQPNERLIGGALSWYLDDRGYPVRLDACASKGDTYAWTIVGSQGTTTTKPRALGKRTCATTVLLPEGAQRLTLAVTSGARTLRSSITAQVSNLLLVAFGDSFASGEGNPRNVEAWQERGGPFTPFRPYWDDDACHRSTRGAPAQAALALEKASPFTSVTLIHVACSGATMATGVLGPYPAAGQALSQVEQVRRLIGTRSIDLVTLSAGGNDIGFTDVLRACATNADCPIGTPPRGALAGYPTVQEGVQARLGQLPASYAALAACLGGAGCPATSVGQGAPLALSPGAAVLNTMYPDITRGADGSPCTYLTYRAANMAWARDAILVPVGPPTYAYPSTSRGTVALALPNGTLNQQVGTTDRLRWTPVIGSWAASGDSAVGHGICAGSDAWVFGLSAFSGMDSAAFHPNPTGQRVIAKALTDAMTGAVSISSARR